MNNLADIVRRRDLQALETYAIRIGTYAALIDQAKRQGIDLDELEELLGEIS